MISLDKSKRYLLGCSFGPDSMALFAMLLKNNYDFEVAIVNYHLRNESDSEVEGLEKFCKKFNKKLYILDVKNVPNKNVEEECRNIRYEFFNQLIREHNLYGLVVGHHQDDLLETYLMQKERKILPIYYGIQYKSHVFGIDVYRPLLEYSKAELQKFCDENKIPYMIDKSNFDTSILRNKIRHNIVEKMSNIERDKLVNDINEENAKLKSLLENISTSSLHDVNYLLSLDEISFLYAINILKNQYGKYPDLSRKQCLELLKLLKSKKPNIKTEITEGLFFIKEYNNVKFASDEDNVSYFYAVVNPTILDTPYFYLDFTKGYSNRGIKEEDFPLSIRNARNDDTYKIKGYNVSLNRLFIDWKMPITLRKKWPVIINNSGVIVYIPRYQEDFKITNDLNFYVKI